MPVPNMPPQPNSPFNMRPTGMPPGARSRRPPRPKECDDDLIRQCREILAAKIPESNVVFVDEFERYMPLFNQELRGEMEENAARALCREFHGRFSLQHPIKILAREYDPNGFMHPTYKKRFKLEKEIPAQFRQVSTLNDVGMKVPALINAFFNATAQPSGPFDERKAKYAKAIADAIGLADSKKAVSIQQQRQEYARAATKLVRKDSGAEAQTPTEQETGGDGEVSEGLIQWD